jgi:Ni,Fe-hydrogenase I cytochrome b subunit
MFNGLRELMDSAHGTVLAILLLASALLVIVGSMNIDQWTNFVEWIFGASMGGHAVMAAADSLSAKRSDPKTDKPANGVKL